MSKLKPFWEPIETAPKDGSGILLLSAPYEDEQTGSHPAKIAIGHWWAEGSSWVADSPHKEDSIYTLQQTGTWLSGGGWFQPDEVTHWSPLPVADSGFKMPRKARARYRQDKIQRQGKQIMDLVGQRDEARLESARLRAALEAVEWVCESYMHGDSVCPWCEAGEDDGHKSDCARQAALAAEAADENKERDAIAQALVRESIRSSLEGVAGVSISIEPEGGKSE